MDRQNSCQLSTSSTFHGQSTTECTSATQQSAHMNPTASNVQELRYLNTAVIFQPISSVQIPSQYLSIPVPAPMFQTTFFSPFIPVQYPVQGQAMQDACLLRVPYGPTGGESIPPVDESISPPMNQFPRLANQFSRMRINFPKKVSGSASTRQRNNSNGYNRVAALQTAAKIP